MAEYLIVALIVGGSAWYAGMKYLPAKWRRRLGQKKPAAGCGSGCDSCNACADEKPAAAQTRVIKLHKA